MVQRFKMPAKGRGGGLMDADSIMSVLKELRRDLLVNQEERFLTLLCDEFNLEETHARDDEIETLEDDLEEKRDEILGLEDRIKDLEDKITELKKA